MTLQSGKQTISIHALPNILRSKRIEIMKFNPLIEYNMRNILLEKTYRKYDGQTSDRLFSKETKLTVSLINILKFCTVYIYFIPSRGLLKYSKTKLQTTCYYLV